MRSIWRAALAAFALFTPVAALAQSAGTTPLSLVQQFSISGTPLAGCLVYFFVPGTVATPQQIYADFGLTQPLPNPLQCDQSGRVPLHWLPSGLTHIRLTDSSGVVQVDTTMQVLGPSSGGGGGGTTIDPTTILGTGDMKVKYGTGPLSGFVRANGLTIGSATSGATERANADTQNLFTDLWNTDPNLVVPGGRGATAAADWAANKQITLPDLRGRVPVALDDMGNSPAGRLTAANFGPNVTTLGSAGGGAATIAQNQLPNATLTAAVTASTSGKKYADYSPVSVSEASISGGGSFATLIFPIGQNVNIGDVSVSGAGTTSSINGGVTQQTFSEVTPAVLMTFYIKL